MLLCIDCDEVRDLSQREICMELRQLFAEPR